MWGKAMDADRSYCVPRAGPEIGHISGLFTKRVVGSTYVDIPLSSRTSKYTAVSINIMFPPQNGRLLPTAPGSVEVQLLDSGSFTANLDVVHAGSAPIPYRCYSWVFYIYHKTSGKHILWDVGLSDVSEDTGNIAIHHRYLVY